MIVALASIVALATAAPGDLADPPEWKRVAVPEAGFSQTFPGVPSRTQVPTQLLGRQARGRIFVLDRGEARWAVTVFESDDLLSSEEVRLLPEGMAAFMKDVVRKGTVFHQGRRAVEVEQRVGPASILSRFIPGENRMYAVVVIARSGPLPTEAARFLESFRIIPVVAPGPPPPRTHPDRWSEYAPESARFAARFPTAPVEEPGETSDGTPTRSFVAEQDGVRYTVRRVPLSGVDGRETEAVDYFVNQARDDFARKSMNPVVSERGTVSSFPFRDLKLAQAGTTGVIRVIVTPDAMYKVAVIATAGVAEPGQTRFLDSFRIVAKK